MRQTFGPFPTVVRLAPVICVALSLMSCGSPESRAQAYYDSAVKLLAANENKKAAIEFRNALRLKDDLVPAWRGLAKAERAINDLAGLVAALKGVLAHDAGDSATRIELAKLFLVDGATDEALKLANEAPAPRDANLIALRAIISATLKDDRAAAQEARAALKMQPGNVDALKVLAADRLTNNDPEGALELLLEVGGAGNSDIGVQLVMIRIYEQLDDLPKLEKLLRRLAEQYPKQVTFRRQLIKFYIGQHRVDDAEEELRHLAAEHRANSEFGIELARLLYVTKGLAAARAEIARQINKGGDVFPYQMALAELECKESDNVDCFTLLKKLSQKEKLPEHALMAKMKLAQLSAAHKHFEVANILISEILEDDSFAAWKFHGAALGLRASIRLELNKPEMAISDLLEAVNANPHSADLMLLLGIAYDRNGAIDLAERQFANALKASNLDPAIGLKYASFLRARGKTQRAEDVLLGLSKRWPEDVSILATLAELKILRQDWSGAEEISESLRRMPGNSVVADRILGETLSGQHNYDASIVVLRKAVAAAPSDAQLTKSLVRALVGGKQTDKAVSFLENVLKSNPENAEAYVLLGSIQLSNDAPADAMTNFKLAIEKQPSEDIGYRGLAEFYITEKNMNAALGALRAGLGRKPNSSTLHLATAEVLEQVGNYEGAISEYEEVLKLQPDSLIAVNNLASLLADQLSDAASLARAQSFAVRLRESEVPQFKDTVGWIAYRRGDIRAAIPLLQQAAVALPDQAVIHYHLGMSYLGIREFNKASGEFRAALAKAPNVDLKKRIDSELARLPIQ